MFSKSKVLYLPIMIILAHLFVLQSALAVPVRTQDLCEAENGTWVEDGSACAPCSQCRTVESTIREETSVSCNADCRPTCLCPEGSLWYRNRCTPVEEVTLCIEDQEIACGEEGGEWDTCRSDCNEEICATTDGDLQVETTGECTTGCLVTCICPNQVWNGSTCVDYQDFYPACEESAGEETTGGETTGGETTGGETVGGETAGGQTAGETASGEMNENEDNGVIIEESSCEQLNSKASLWLFMLGFLLLNAYRRFAVKL